MSFLSRCCSNCIAFCITHAKKLPLVIADSAKQKEIADLVKKILGVKGREAGTDTAMWEQEIDRLVYDLYGMTKDEIAIIERS